jgi:hypothetical protein
MLGAPAGSKGGILLSRSRSPHSSRRYGLGPATVPAALGFARRGAALGLRLPVLAFETRVVVVWCGGGPELSVDTAVWAVPVSSVGCGRVDGVPAARHSAFLSDPFVAQQRQLVMTDGMQLP